MGDSTNRSKVEAVRKVDVGSAGEFSEGRGVSSLVFLLGTNEATEDEVLGVVASSPAGAEF